MAEETRPTYQYTGPQIIVSWLVDLESLSKCRFLIPVRQDLTVLNVMTIARGWLWVFRLILLVYLRRTLDLRLAIAVVACGSAMGCHY